jgi:uncharacterized RDD family membrane protein YckC
MEILDDNKLSPSMSYEYATFGERFLASLIDGLIIIVPIFLINLFLPLAGSIVLGWLYAALQESGRTQATIGKRAMGILVVDLDGYPISFGKASGRHFGKIVSGMILYIGFFMALFTERKQTLHDMMAGCIVIKGKIN